MIALIDYDAGNIRSVEKALAALGEETEVTRDAERILAADRVILPGVGSFGDAMGKLHSFQLVDVIKETIPVSYTHLKPTAKVPKYVLSGKGCGISKTTRMLA